MVFIHKAVDNVNLSGSFYEQFRIFSANNQHPKIALDECEPIN